MNYFPKNGVAKRVASKKAAQTDFGIYGDSKREQEQGKQFEAGLTEEAIDQMDARTLNEVLGNICGEGWFNVTGTEPDMANEVPPEEIETVRTYIKTFIHEQGKPPERSNFFRQYGFDPEAENDTPEIQLGGHPGHNSGPLADSYNAG